MVPLVVQANGGDVGVAHGLVLPNNIKAIIGGEGKARGRAAGPPGPAGACDAQHHPDGCPRGAEAG